MSWVGLCNQRLFIKRLEIVMIKEGQIYKEKELKYFQIAERRLNEELQ